MQNEVRNEIPEEDTIDLIELLMAILRHWLLIGLTAVLFALIAFAYSSFLITPQYEATSKLYVLSKSTSITSMADIQLGSNLTNDYMIVVSGRPVLDQVIANLHLDLEYGETYKSLYNKVSLKNPSSTRILEITVRDTDPVLAKIIADEIANVSRAFISEKMDQDPPSVLQYGYIDTRPVSPSVPKYTVIGTLAGGVLAAGLVVLVHIINDTINTAEDVEKKLGLKVIAQVPLDIAETDSGKQKKRRSFRLPRLFKKKKKKPYRK